MRQAATDPKMGVNSVTVDETHLYSLKLLKNYEQINTDKEIKTLENSYIDGRVFEDMSQTEKMIYLDKNVTFNKFKKDINTFIKTQIRQIQFKEDKCKLKLCYKNIFMSHEKVQECNSLCSRDKEKFMNFMNNKLGKC